MMWRRLIERDITMRFFSAALSFIFSCGACSWADAKDCQFPIEFSEGQVISLVGILNQSKEWGPPNFGENPQSDSKIDVWFLAPPNDTTFKAHQVELKVDRIQLSRVASVLDEKQLASMRGRIVQVKGSLSSASSPGDYTSVVILPKTIELFSGNDAKAVCE
jgi:hypothetical protein